MKNSPPHVHVLGRDLLEPQQSSSESGGWGRAAGRGRLLLPDAPSGIRFLPQLQFVLWSINLATGTSSYVRSVPPRGNGSVLHGGLPQHSSGRGEWLSLASPEWPPSCLLPDPCTHCPSCRDCWLLAAHL